MERWTLPKENQQLEACETFEQVCTALIDGKLVAVPTETVYGLAADATNGEACARIYEAKGRPSFNPLISHVESLEAAEKHGVFCDAARMLAEAFWPGPLTIVVPKAASCTVSDLATAGLDSVALRVPDAPVMQKLAERIGRPLAAPSANLSGKISGTTADDVIADLERSLAFIIDNGPTTIGVESTIVSFLGPRPTLLRPGGLEREKIEALLGQSLATAGTDDSAPRAPGMLTSHYAPSSGVRLNAVEVKEGETLITLGDTYTAGQENARSIINLSESGCLREAAANLFTALRKADAGESSMIAVVPVPVEGLGEAINDRLARAAAPRG
ncbi:threonylcarbamoyl-AMP synthase [Rhodobacteraceae bacterium RKSG542]|uniref:L-threonylcarbamoyladenylate synthase n=1 Tax=Pseudovibrio flavus TaxID=2529854 RepID=UPI0012BB97A6|nr:L-threonylcarbamoyladenylate synthase [Pseudovibrio flavus]MTI18741.1 threonylcarbamoyl-AMP synthase [Pseudovibrio flavus]